MRTALRHQRTTRVTRGRFATGAAVCAAAVALCLLLSGAPSAAAAGGVTLNVVTAGPAPQAVDHYKYLIVRDDAGDPSQPQSACLPSGAGGSNPSYPDGCNWPSIHSTPGGTAGVNQIVTQGDETVMGPSNGIALDPGKYVISVQAYDATGAQTAKIDGTHFTVPASGDLNVTVQVDAYDLPLATMRVQVFNDTATNGQWDIPAEPGLSNFVGHINDVLAEVTTDWYGNPLCTIYKKDPSDPNPSSDPFVGPYEMDANGKPVIDTIGGKCLSDSTGLIEIGNLGSNRYTVTVTPPTSGPNASSHWLQTTTLEGGHDWDTWHQEGSNGFDGELIRGGEGVPETIAGFVAEQNTLTNTNVTGEITGQLNGIRAYTPPAKGLVFGGEAGNAIDPPVSDGWVSLVSIDAGDTAVYVKRADTQGRFDIKHVPNGDYELVTWDENQDYLVETNQATVRNGQLTKMKTLYLAHWFGIVKGTVFNDYNSNGKQDPGEPGVPNLTVTLKSRDNSLQDQGTASYTTDSNGHYIFREAYPLGQWVVEEMYDPRYYTTGVTYQTDNQPSPTTILGAGVDLNTFHLVGLSNRIDWGIRPYDRGTNGGIVGEVVYETTRNELDPRFMATEDYEGGISGLKVDLYAPVPDPNNPGQYLKAADGSYQLGPKLNQYTTEQWQRPTGCTSRDVNGDPVSWDFMPDFPSVNATNKDCLEGFAMQNQVGFWGNQSDQFSLVNGNYGFGTQCTPDANGNSTFSGNPDDCQDPLGPGDYLVRVEVPNDPITHQPVYKPVREEDINIATGDSYTPQEPPYPCAGALHTVDVAGSGQDSYGPVSLDGGTVTVPASTPTANPGFADIGGSPYEGEQKPICDTQLVTLKDQYSATPNFHFFTDVPVPGRFHGLVTDDLTLSSNPKELFYGEKLGIPNMPVGLYDYTGRLVDTMHTDANGVFEDILPSVSSYNCPLPAGPCPNVYRFVANDPGTPEHPNADFNPNYRTAATNFQLWPNLTLPADLAPVPIAQLVEGPGTQTLHPADCTLPTAIPQMFSVSRPYQVNNATTAQRTITITGKNFGNATGTVLLDGVSITSAVTGSTSGSITSWTDNQIVAQMPSRSSSTASSAASRIGAPHQLIIRTAGAGAQSTIDGLTYHILGGNYTPTVIEVGPGKQFDTQATTPATVQDAINAANPGTGRRLVVVYPDTPSNGNPLGSYFENVVMNKPIKLQGVGPGGIYTAGGTQHAVPGSILNGRYFYTQGGFAADGDNNYATDWTTLVSGLTRTGNQNIYEGPVVSVYPRTTGQFTSAFPGSIDGFTLMGGDQIDFPGSLFDNGGGPVPNPVGDPTQEAAVTQGGGVYVNAQAHFMHVTNNVIDGNGGSYGGAIRVGTPNIGSNNNNNLLISHNRILHNGGSNLAGAVALFTGANNYDLSFNDVCGNFSSEYGGGISHFGLSPGGQIHDNQIYLNGSYDEGAGVMIAGELPANPKTTLTRGSGSVSVFNNLIQENVANDDGGGLRLLMTSGANANGTLNDSQISIFNNMIVNNVSTHEGGGVALDDATNTRFYNNTVMKNITTATAATSNGQPAPAGLSDTGNSTLLQAKLPASHAHYSDPLMFNNVFDDNRAGAWDLSSGTVSGIGQTGDPAPIRYWDMGVADGLGPLHPHHTLLQGYGPSQPVAGAVPAANDGTNTLVAGTPGSIVVNPYDTLISPFPWRGDPHFIAAITIAQSVAELLAGNYHLAAGSQALNLAVNSQSGVNAPTFDIDNQTRPSSGKDLGADER